MAKAQTKEQRAVLDQAVIVIDAEDFERSQKDPRVHDLFKRGQALHAELELLKGDHGP
jgi:hypothetical protein